MSAGKQDQAHLHFICSVSCDFEKFLRMFQESAPLIHILHDELTELIRSLLHRFVKAELELKVGAYFHCFLLIYDDVLYFYICPIFFWYCPIFLPSLSYIFLAACWDPWDH